MQRWQLVEQASLQWVRKKVDSTARLTGGSADGGLDIVGRRSLVQVKSGTTRVGRPKIQQLHGAAQQVSSRRKVIFIAEAGYSRPAVEYANGMKVALVVVDMSGRKPTFHAMNGHARSLTTFRSSSAGPLPTPTSPTRAAPHQTFPPPAASQRLPNVGVAPTPTWGQRFAAWQERATAQLDEDARRRRQAAAVVPNRTPAPTQPTPPADTAEIAAEFSRLWAAAPKPVDAATSDRLYLQAVRKIRGGL